MTLEVAGRVSQGKTQRSAYTTVCCHDYQSRGDTVTTYRSSMRQIPLGASVHIFAFIENTDD